MRRAGLDLRPLGTAHTSRPEMAGPRVTVQTAEDFPAPLGPGLLPPFLSFYVY